LKSKLLKLAPSIQNN